MLNCDHWIGVILDSFEAHCRTWWKRSM